MDKCVEVVEWIRHCLEHILRWLKPVSEMCIHFGSQFVIGRAQRHMLNGKSRHIRQKHNYIRQLISTGIITLECVRLNNNIAYLLTR